MKITVATYNVLARAYVKPKFYPNCRAKHFPSEVRYPRLVERIVGLKADVVCLQEVDHRLFRLVEKRLAKLGYEGRWAHKSGRKPDGCATFVRKPWTLTEAHILRYADGPTPSGHVALITTVRRDGVSIAVANTHLKWDKPDTAPEKRRGLAQEIELLEALTFVMCPQIVCGDFNVTADDQVIADFRAVGFDDAHPVEVATCNPSGQARKIDYLLHSDDLVAHPKRATPVEDKTPLPSATEPSDHIPLVATFETRA